MALWCWLNVNDQRIGLLDIQRHEPLDLTDREAVADVVSTYAVRIDGVERATVRHRYGDGAWALLRTALAVAVPDRVADVPTGGSQISDTGAVPEDASGG